MRRALFAALLIVPGSAARAAVYEIDPVHSHVSFRIKHLVGRVSGRFGKFSGTVSYESGKPKAWTVDVAIDPASIDTDNDKRDAHLRNADFFDTAKCPEMKFVSKEIKAAAGDTAKLVGELTMHCVTKLVELDLEIGGVTKDPWGNEKAGFSAKGAVNRKDFGIVWNKTLDSGGLMLGEDVEVTIDLETQKSASGKPNGKPAKAKKG